jgi:polyhydroxyalkanoate synthesis regulator phasin
MTVAERTSPSPGDGGGLTDALRRYVDAVAGFTELPRDRAEKIIGDLARRGESRARDLSKAARELADRSTHNRRELVGLIQKEIRRQMESRGFATREEVSRLQQRVQQLEKKQAPKARAAPKRKPAKRTASKKSTGR